MNFDFVNTGNFRVTPVGQDFDFNSFRLGQAERAEFESLFEWALDVVRGRKRVIAD